MINPYMQTFGVRSNFWIPLLHTDLSVLPGDVSGVLSAPTATTPVFIAIALSFSILFFLSFTLISLRHKMSPKLAAVLEKPMLQRSSAWLGVFGFLVGTNRALPFYRLD